MDDREAGPAGEPDDSAIQRALVDKRLGAFGVSTDICHQIAGGSLVECRKAPPRGSAGGRGIYAYEGGLSEMTAQFEEVGYRREDVSNLPVFLNAKLGKAVILTSGDAQTGQLASHVSPGTKHRKGTITHQAIRGNQLPGQDVLGEVVSFEALRPDTGKSKVEKFMAGLRKYLVYFYMLHFDFEDSQIRSEFAMPTAYQETKCIASWLHRVIVPPYPIEDDFRPGEPPEEIDFPLPPI